MPEDNRTNIKIDDDVHARHNEKRKELGLSWTEYMRRLEWQDGGGASPEIDADEIATEVVRQMDYTAISSDVANDVVKALR